MDSLPDDVVFLPSLIKDASPLEDIAFCQKGYVSLGGRSFAPNEPILDFEFGGGLIANRPLTARQTIEVELDGKVFSSTWNHRDVCGFLTFGMWPILEIKNPMTGQCFFFKYMVSECDVDGWYRITPTRSYAAGLLSVIQVRRIFALLWATFLLGIGYLILTNMLLWGLGTY